MTHETVRLYGACRRAAAIDALGRSAVRRAVESGQWCAAWPGVLIEASRAAEPLTVIAAALRYAGPDALVTGRTAAHLHGCTAVPPLPVHLLVPYGHWLRARAGLVAHNGRPADEDRDEVAGLPSLRLEPVLSDLLCRDRPQDALAVLDQALGLAGDAGREGLRRRIGDELARRADPRGRRRATRLLELGTGRAESPPESWMLFHLVDVGFPAPEVNWSFDDRDGRQIFRLDLAWPEYRIALEYDGYLAHLGREGADRTRQAALERSGWIVVRAGTDDLGSLYRVECALDEAFRRRGLVLRRRPGVLRGQRHREKAG
ncbi:hypothetical protein [Pseudonocardia sp. T1-2H]|uniref:hypothetical protein n=1 Tax=Pseudonocardia sp. T1-2H TaxID=3128899 RepID=UPI0031011472